MKVSYVFAERNPNTFIKVFIKVKRFWFSKPTLYYSYKVTTKLERTWWNNNTNNVVKSKLAKKLTKAYDEYMVNNTINYI